MAFFVKRLGPFSTIFLDKTAATPLPWVTPWFLRRSCWRHALVALGWHRRWILSHSAVHRLLNYKQQPARCVYQTQRMAAWIWTRTWKTRKKRQREKTTKKGEDHASKKMGAVFCHWHGLRGLGLWSLWGHRFLHGLCSNFINLKQNSMGFWWILFCWQAGTSQKVRSDGFFCRNLSRGAHGCGEGLCNECVLEILHLWYLWSSHLGNSEWFGELLENSEGWYCQSMGRCWWPVGGECIATWRTWKNDEPKTGRRFFFGRDERWCSDRDLSFLFLLGRGGRDVKLWDICDIGSWNGEAFMQHFPHWIFVEHCRITTGSTSSWVTPPDPAIGGSRVGSSTTLCRTMRRSWAFHQVQLRPWAACPMKLGNSNHAMHFPTQPSLRFHCKLVKRPVPGDKIGARCFFFRFFFYCNNLPKKTEHRKCQEGQQMVFLVISFSLRSSCWERAEIIVWWIAWYPKPPFF